MDRAQPTLIYETLHGSRAYGLDRESSDTDVKGVIVGPPIWYHGFVEPREQLDLSADHVLFEIRKFIRLAAAANPMSLELLFADAADHRCVTAAGLRLLDAREQLPDPESRRDVQRLCHGTAETDPDPSALVARPPLREPTRAEYGLPNATVVPKDQLGAAETLIETRRLARRRRQHQLPGIARAREALQASAPALDPVPIVAGRPEPRARRTRSAAWLRHETRDASRSAATHGDRDPRERPSPRAPARPGGLLAIRDGAWSYDELAAASEAMTQRASALRATSNLPAEPDYDALNHLCAEIVEEVLRA